MLLKLITLMILTTSSVTYKLPEAEKLAREVIDAAQFQEHDPLLFASLITEESHWDPTARSKMGAYGLPHLHPAYWPPRSFQTRWAQLYQASTILAMYRKKCGGEWRAVAAYRSGQCSTVGPATKKVFKTHRKWIARWRTLQSGGTMEHGPSLAQAHPSH